MYRRAGGASIAASRHSEAMRMAGVSSDMLTLDDLLAGRPLRKLIYKIDRWLRFKVNGLYGVFGSFGFMWSGFRLDRHPKVLAADVIYLHWVDDGLLSVKGMERLLRLGKPVYWFMHDMLPVTGGCHYSMDCRKYCDSCSGCPLIKRHFLPDIVACSFTQKLGSWRKYPNLSFLAPSRWLADCASASAIGAGHMVAVCPNLIDTNKFKPGDKAAAKACYFGADSRKVVLFGAEAVSNPYKGWEYMLRCLTNLDPSEYVCLVLGQNDRVIKETVLDTVFTGRLDSEDDIIRVYLAADVFVTPTLADNFPNVLLEAMACGLPCVGFDSGGVRDLILHKTTGYLSARCDALDLKAGVEWVTGDAARYAALSSAAREYVSGHFSYENCSSVHKELNL
ncbi:MAG: glycosyltransferase [Bacteroidales bacterium]|nr:glycosyltransferase [Bacteroidales bacterium]